MKKRGGLNERKIWNDIRISMNLKKKRWGLNKRKIKKKKQKKKLSPDLSELIWTDMKKRMNLKKKRGGLNERKIWTDIGISMNLKKKNKAVYTAASVACGWTGAVC